MNNYVYKNPYVKESTARKIVTPEVEAIQPAQPFVFKNPYAFNAHSVSIKPEEDFKATKEIRALVEEKKKQPAGENVKTTLPASLVKAIDDLKLSRIMRDKALKLVSIIILKSMYNNHDLSAPIPLAAHYFEKAFNKEYHKDFFNKMKAANIIQSTGEYRQGSKFKKGKAMCYRINNELLNDAYVPVFYEDRKPIRTEKDGGLSKAEIFINRTYYNKNTNDRSSNSINYDLYSHPTNQVLSNNSLSIHISSRLFQKSLIIDDLSSLEYNQDKIWIATKERIANISSRLFVDDKILRDSFEVTNCLLNNFKYHTTKERAIKWAKEHEAAVVQDGRHFYIQKLKKFIRDKKLNVYRHYKWQMARITGKLFYAKRNDTNWRVDHNLTCAGKNFMEVIKIENDLIEIDIKNSQFAIHAYWMKQEGLCSNKDVQRYYEMCSNGVLYDEIGKELGIKREAAKQLMFEMVFSSHKFNTSSKKHFRKNFPNVIKHIDEFKKKMKNSELFSIELQQLESEIVIDNLYPNIKELGIFCLTKHDSLIIKKSDEEKVVKLIQAYFNQIGFECTLDRG